MIGVFAALYLARAGQKALLCEKGRIAGEQSSRNWGWIRQQGRDAAELPIMMRALRLRQEADAQTGGAYGVRVAGTTFLSRSISAEAEYEAWVRTATAHGLESKLLTPAQIADLFGGAAGQRWEAAVHTPSDARGEPWQAAPAVASLARADGVLVREDCAIRALEISAGRVSGVITEDGRVRCAQVILAAGAWSSLFARRHGISIPQLTLRGTVVRTAPLPQVLNGAACDEELGFRRREDGGYTLALADRHSFFLGPDSFRHAPKYLALLKSAWRMLEPYLAQPYGFPDAWRTPRRWSEDEVSPFERVRVLEPHPSQAQVDLIATLFAARFPGLGLTPIATTWAGMIETMPDVVPIVDRVPGVEGLIMATGMSAHGFGIGPSYGEILSRTATGQPAGEDMGRFRFDRFMDGSKIELGPEL